MTPDVARPNILLIVLDSARADRMSCYGHDHETTPHLDAIAREGTLFENCYSESNWTLPVCFTLLTGLAPREHRSADHRQLPDAIPTLQDAMKQAGYTTMLASANQFAGRRCGLDRGFDHYFMPPHVHQMTKTFFVYFGRYLALTDLGGGAVNTHLLRWLDEVPEPWFAAVWHNESHHPYIAPRPFTTRFSPRRLSAWRRARLLLRMHSMRQLGATASARELQDVRALYDGSLAYADHLTGQVVERLRSTGAWERTVCVVTADHGDMLGERGLMGHGRAAGLYRPLVRVPLILRIPGEAYAGIRSPALVQLADVPTTLEALIGHEGSLAPSAAPRLDLRTAPADGGRPFAVSERQRYEDRRLHREARRNPAFDFTPHRGRMARLMRDGWTYIHAETGDDQLFHTTEDPAETSDLVASEPQRAARMAQQLREWEEAARPHPAVVGLEPDDDPRTRKRLEGLGYF